MPLDALPPDERAVLQLVLRQGRSYAALAGLLRIDPEEVRVRARLGAETLAPAPDDLGRADRGEVVDYLLGQDPLGRGLLEESAPARDWAELLSIHLSPLAAAPLPEVPMVRSGGAPEMPPAAAAGAPPAPRPAAPAEASAPAAGLGGEAEGDLLTAPGRERSSRLGGALLLAGIGIFVGVLVIVLLNSGSGGPSGTSTPSTAAQSPPPATTPATTPTTPGTGTGTNATSPRPIGTAALKTADNSKTTVGVAQLIQQGTTAGFVVAAKGIPTKPGTYHGVWLTGSGVKPLFLGSVRNQDVRSGRISAVAPVPKNVRSFTTMIVTLQPTASTKKAPTTPGQTILSGPLKITGKLASG